MKIVILDSNALNPGDMNWNQIRAFGEVTTYPRTQGKEEIIARIGNSDIVLLNKVPINSEILDACPSIKLICCLSTGYNVVDIQAARARNIPVCNVPAYSTAAVSQFTFALLLELCHRIGHHDKTVHDGKWSACPDFCYWDTPQMELAGKTMGIIGFGRIGRAVGKIAKAFGMNVIAYNRSQCEEGKAIGNYVNLDELLATADIISLHCPLTAENTGMINGETIAKMKDGAFLINTARGGLIDENALAEALQSGKLAGAGLDVLATEPPACGSPLLGLSNCHITPHIAFIAPEARQTIMDVCAENIRSFLRGETLNRLDI